MAYEPTEGEFDTPAFVPKTPYQPGPVAVLPRWRVVLHDDEVQEHQYVVDVLSHHLPISRPTATRRVIEAQKHGTAVVLYTHRELAEHYYVMLSKRKLIVSIERAIA